MESNFSYTFKDLWQEVLNYLGQDRDAADIDLLAKAKRRVNDAYRKFLALNWGFLSKQAVLTVESGKDTYELPDDFGIIRTSFKAFPNTTYINPVEDTVSNIWECQKFYPQNGPPIKYTFKSEYDAEVGIRYNVVFYPIPNITIQYHYEYKVLPKELVEDDDIPYCPANLSHVLREFCLVEVELFDEEGAKTTHTNQLYQILLPQAIRENSLRQPNTVGSLSPQTITIPYGTVGIVYGQRFQY